MRPSSDVRAHNGHVHQAGTYRTHNDHVHQAGDVQPGGKARRCGDPTLVGLGFGALPACASNVGASQGPVPF